MVVKGNKQKKKSAVVEENEFTRVQKLPKIKPQQKNTGPLLEEVKTKQIKEFDLFDIRLVRKNEHAVTREMAQRIQIEAVHQAIKEINKVIAAVNERNRGTSKEQIAELTINDFEATSYTKVVQEDQRYVTAPQNFAYFPVDMKVKETKMEKIEKFLSITNLSINIDDPVQHTIKTGLKDNGDYQVSSFSNNKINNHFFFVSVISTGTSCWLYCSF